MKFALTHLEILIFFSRFVWGKKVTGPARIYGGAVMINDFVTAHFHSLLSNMEGSWVHNGSYEEPKQNFSQPSYAELMN